RRVEVDLVRVQGQAGEPDVVGLGDRAAVTTTKAVADLEILVEPAPPGLRCSGCLAAHVRSLLSASVRIRRARSTTGRSTIAPFRAKTPRPSPDSRSYAVTTPRAHTSSASLGANTLCTTSSWRGWMHALPRKPSD